MLGCNRFINRNQTLAGLDTYIALFRGHGRSHNDISCTGSHGNIADRRHILAHDDIAVVHFKVEVTIGAYIYTKGDAAFVFHLGINIPFGFCMVRNFNIAVISLQTQIAGCGWILRITGCIQFTVKRNAVIFNDQIIIVVRIPRRYRNIAYVRLGFATYFNDPVLSGKIYILFCMDRKIRRTVTADADIAFPGSNSNVNAAFLSRYGLHNFDISVVRPDRHIPCLGQHIAIQHAALVPQDCTYDDISFIAGN